MAPTHVQTVRAETTDAVSSITYSNFAVGSGANRTLVAYILWADASATSPTVTGVVFNTTENFTYRGRSRYGGAGDYIVEIWTLDNPTNTTADVVATLSETNSSGDGVALILSEYTGANNGVGINVGADKGLSTSATTTFTTGANTSLIIVGLVAAAAPTSFAPAGDEIERWEESVGNIEYAAYEHPASGGSDTITITIDPEYYWVIVAVELKAAASSIVGETCWGHDTGVTETNKRDFTGNWTGTGAITGAGDAERLELDAGEYMISEVVNTGVRHIELDQNHYAAGDAVNLDYRHGADQAACEAAAWNDYSAPFESLGYVQIRVTSTL